MKRKIAYNLWDKKEEVANEWIPNPPKKSRKMKSKNKVKSALPDPGASYNPRAADHVALLTRAAKVEMIREKKEEKVDRALRNATSLSRAAAIALAKSEQKEMERGLFSDDEDQEGTTIVTNEEVALPNDFLGRRKTKAERKKQKMNDEKETEDRKKKMAKDFAHQLNNIPKLMKEVKKELNEKANKKKKVDRKSRRLGRFRYKDDEFDEPMQMPEDLRPSLRLMKSTGNPLEDFYKDLQKRRIIEPRDRNQIRHRKVFKKAYEKK